MGSPVSLLVGFSFGWLLSDSMSGMVDGEERVFEILR